MGDNTLQDLLADNLVEALRSAAAGDIKTTDACMNEASEVVREIITETVSDAKKPD
jgi:hypothetical protein